MAKGRKPRAKKDEKLPVREPSVENEPTVESEMAVTESQAPGPTPPTRGKKRASEEAGPWNSSSEEAHVAKKKRTTRVRASSSSAQAKAKASDYAMFDPASPASDETAIEAELRALERDMEVGDELQLQEQLDRDQEQENEPQILKKSRKTGTRKVSKQTRKTKETSMFITSKPEVQPIAPEREPEMAPSLPQPAEDFAVKPGAAPEIQQQKLPTPESIADVKPKANIKPKSKPKTKKMSLPPREPSKPRLSLQELEDLEGPDELHEDSFVSAHSTNTATWDDAESEKPAAIAPPVKKGRGRSLKKLAGSVRSNASSAAEASAQPAAVAEITPISPPHNTATTMAVDLSAPKRRKSSDSITKLEAIEKNARRSQTDDKASNSSTKTKQPHASRAPTMSVSAVPVPMFTHTASPAPTTPRKQQAPVASAKQATLSPSQSPQSSDAENHPPSSRPATISAGKVKRVALATMQIPTALAAPSTPGGISTYARPGSPSKRSNTIGGLRSAISWSAVDVDAIFDIDKENGDDILGQFLRKGTDLSTPEKAMTVEGFIFHNAGQAERMLKEGCEAMVSVFEQQGTEAMRVLESLEVGE
ncbi:hypothetical protein SEPCBS57363_001410 [Sporothrix epigloea]|uniref:Uncharacterized protein n=1 Tax=Sporothrix epigloea TaxID=1892477 RepID=A0ABP0DA46_9PEZI